MQNAECRIVIDFPLVSEFTLYLKPSPAGEGGIRKLGLSMTDEVFLFNLILFYTSSDLLG